MKRVVWGIIIAINLLSCAGTKSGVTYYHDDNVNVNEMKNSSILLLPVKFFSVNNDMNKRFTLSPKEFNLTMAGTVVSEMGRLGYEKAFIFNQQKQQELTLFLDIADLSYIAGKSGYNDISNISSFSTITQREGIDYVIFTRSVAITFISDEKSQGVKKIQDGSAKITMEIIMFDVKNKKIIKQLATEDIVGVLDNPSEAIFGSIKNRIFEIFLHSAEHK